MSEKKTIELHAFIAEHVMKWRRVNFAIVSKESFCVMDTGVYIYASPNSMAPFAPATDRAAAMEVLEKLVDNDDVTIRAIANQFLVSTADDPDKAPNRNMVKAGTLPLAIALFAKKIYEKD